jgi:hypothetical protein
MTARPRTIGGKQSARTEALVALRRRDSGDERTSLRLGAISERRQIPNDPGPRLAGSDEKDAYVVAMPLCSGARGTCGRQRTHPRPTGARSGGGETGGLVPRVARVFGGRGQR